MAIEFSVNSELDILRSAVRVLALSETMAVHKHKDPKKYAEACRLGKQAYVSLGAAVHLAFLKEAQDHFKDLRRWRAGAKRRIAKATPKKGRKVVR